MDGAMPKGILKRLLGLLGLGAAALLTGCDRGPEVQLLLEPKRPGRATEAVMERAREVIERRMRAFAAGGTSVARQGPNRIVVRFRQQDGVEQVKALVGRSARLEFRLVDASATPEQLRAGQAPIGSELLPFPEGGQNARIAVRRRAIVTGPMIVDAGSGFDSDARPSVNIRLDGAGTRRFARATQENVGRPFAIVLDGDVLSAPLIREPILGGIAQIAGTFTVESANQLALALRSGPLPTDFVVVEERVLAR
jgi:preprotein translocase subunit SecD